MRKTTLIFCSLILVSAFGVKTFGQETPNPPETAKAPEAATHYYHLVFVVEELGADGKPVNSRSYSTSISTDLHQQYGSIRVNSRIPVAVGSFSNDANKAQENTQYQYQNVGVNIDAHNAHEIGHQLSLELEADVSSLANSNDPNLHQPITRQNRWQAMVLIPIGKPTVVFMSDSLDSKGSMQVVVTATPLQ